MKKGKELTEFNAQRKRNVGVPLLKLTKDAGLCRRVAAIHGNLSCFHASSCRSRIHDGHHIVHGTGTGSTFAASAQDPALASVISRLGIFHRTHGYDLLRMLIFLLTLWGLQALNMSWVYHYIRGQASPTPRLAAPGSWLLSVA